MTRFTFGAAVLSVFVCSQAAAQPAPSRAVLRVVSAGPAGDVQPQQDNEVRVVFSEPMVALGRVPSRLKPPFFTIAPDVAGTFRWSGTTILIFTPAKAFPKATRYDVTIAASATAISGRKMAAPYTFSFTTATVKLLQTNWYRPGGRFDAAPIVVLHFSQAVKPEDVLPHLRASFRNHLNEFTPPVIPAADLSRLRKVDAAAPQAFADKVRRATAAASASGPIAFEQAKEWDRKRFPPKPDMVVLRVTTPIPPDSWVLLETDGRLPSLAGLAVSNRPDSYTIQAEPTFFATSFACGDSCDPDSRNPIRFTVPVKTKAFAESVRAVDITDERRERPIAKGTARKRESWEQDESDALSLDDAGLTHPPATTWFATLPATLVASDGQTLGYTWGGSAENWHQTAFTSFGDGHGVWEKGGGAVLPFYARNFQNVKQWATGLDLSQLMPTLLKLQPSFDVVPATLPQTRRFGGAVDRTNSHGLDLSSVLKSNGTGLVWAAVEEGEPVARAKAFHKRDGSPITHSSVVQVTNLAISVKDSPLNTLIFVTRLDNAAPVAGATVSIVRPDGRPSWTGTTANDGVAIAPQTRLRNPRHWDTFSFIVTAEKDGDVAYVGSDWNEGVLPWDFGLSLDLDEADPLLRGTVFTDRGVYKLGEEVHFKALVRSNTPQGIRLLPEGTAIAISVTDARNKVVDERVVKANAWSTAEWTFTIPPEGSLGSYSVSAVLDSQKPKPKAATVTAAHEDYEADWRERKKMVFGSFLVAAYRRPDFRVDVTLTGVPTDGSPKAVDTAIAGDPLRGVVTARYLFGAPMNKRPTHWTLTRSAIYGAPAAVTDKFPEDRWTFVGWWDAPRQFKAEMGAEDAQLAANGQLALTLKTEAAAGVPFSYTLEGDVEDVSRQHIANRKSFTVHPAPWYIGVRRMPIFNEQKDGLKTELVAAGLDGIAVPDVAIDLKLTQIQWQSVRRAEGNGFYSWETERKEVAAGEWHVKSASTPLPFSAPLPAGGYYILEARADAGQGRYTVTRASLYALGEGYTAWQRYDHNRIDLVADKTTYKPGDTAKIMVQSPWEQATALVTTEREGIRTHRQFALTSTQQSIDVPLTDEDIPNVYVSVLLVKGRSKPIASAMAPVPAAGARAAEDAREDDPADPGKPAFRMGYVQLGVEDSSKRLTVAVAANKQEYRPAGSANVTVDVKDRQGRGASSEVTLWAVDYGVLSLTAYRTPDVLDSVYVRKALQVLTEDTRQKIISRRVITPKGDTDGGGGGLGAATGDGVRQDFRVLAFWLGSVVTDAAGHATVDVKLPESLTTYRIMAVAGDKGSRFGSADSEIRINKPLTLKATFPRFLAVGDKASFGAVVTNQLKTGGPATVTIESLDPEVMQFADTAPQTIDVPASGSVEVRFDAAGRTTGRARVRMTVKLANETDAFQDVIPVEVLVSPETVSAVGEAGDAAATAAEKLKLPADVVQTFGGLHVDLASTALVGLGEGARYLVEYPYGCAEQKGSRAIALLLAADLGDAFRLPGIEPARLRPTVQSTLRELERFQCPSGGFAYWPGECESVSPYLTAYLLHVFKVAKDLKYDVDGGMQARAYAYLETELAQKPPVNESWWPSYTAWQAFAVKVLVEGGRNQDSNLTRLYGYRERMPVFALAYLTDALVAKGEGNGVRVAELRRKIANAILPEAATAHVEEMSDPYLMWFWNSNVRSTAIVLRTLVASAAPGDTSLRPIVAWLMQARRNGRWGNTQENAIAMESLVAYYRRFESVTPNFTAVARLGDTQLASVQFQGRSTDAKTAEVSMPKLLAAGPAGLEQPLTFTRNGTGTLFYTARMRYAVDRLFQTGMDQGMRIDRSYAPYVESGSRPAATTYKAGDLIRVTLTLNLTKERRFVAVTDPLPAGFEPVESWFATSAANLSQAQDRQDTSSDWFAWWQRGGFDHVERHDDRVELFATRLSVGRHTFSYVVRATTAGTFRTAPAHVEEMYEPEVFGRTATTVIDVKK
jgi:alpha-2-macroglobulin